MKFTRTMILRIAMAVFLSVIVIAFFIGTFAIRQPKTQAAQSVSSRLFPRIIIAMLALSSIVCLFKEFRSEDLDAENSRKTLALLLSILIMGVSIFLLDILGFAIMGFIFMLLEISVIKWQKPDVKSVLVSFVCSVVFSLMFRYGFKIGIPVLPFGL